MKRLIADYRGTGLTVGPHPMAYRRAQIKSQGIRAACELARSSAMACEYALPER
jgi:error-prone DNA polymerase